MSDTELKRAPCGGAHEKKRKRSGDGQRPSLDDEDAFEHEMFHNPDTSPVEEWAIII